jgi:hypothetical protein
MAHEVTQVTGAARPTAVVAQATTWEAFPALWPALLGEVRALLSDQTGLNVMLYLDDVPNVEVGVLADAAFAPRGRVTAQGLARTGVRFEIYGHHSDDPAQCVTEVHYLLA